MAQAIATGSRWLSIDRLLGGTYLAIVGLTIVLPLPSEILFRFNIKYPFYLLLLLLLALKLFDSRAARQKLLAFAPYAAGLFLFVAVWVVIGLLQVTTRPVWALAHARDLLQTILVICLYYYLHQLRVLSVRSLLVTVMASAAIYSLIKIGLIVLIGAGLADLSLLAGLIDRLQDAAIIGIAPGGFLRIEFLNDSLIAFLPFFVLASDRFGIELKPYQKGLLVLLFVGSAFIVYSRYKWVLVAASTLLGLLVVFRSNWRTAAVAVSLIAAVGAGFALANWQELGTAIFNRFYGSDVDLSDQIRYSQARFLWAAMQDYFFFGKGIGAYVPSLVRSQTTPYSYEQQWLAIGMQFGIVGCTILLGYMLTILWLLLRRPSLLAVCLAVEYGLWLATALFNPSLTTFVGGIVFAIFLACALALDAQHRTLPEQP